ncbi:MAG: radical SAM protein [Magnetococcus sp. YQC-5]
MTPTSRLKVSLVYFGTTNSYFGFRKIAAIAANKCICSVYIVNTGNLFSILSVLKTKKGTDSFKSEDIKLIAETFGQSDILCVSSMSEEALIVKEILREVRINKPEIFLLWGGIHPIVSPEDAIDSDVDAICTSEGEAAFSEFIDCFYDEEKRLGVRNFWFRNGGEIIKNPFRPLLTSNDLNDFPPPFFGDNEYVFERSVGFRLGNINDYLKSNALSYNTIWTRGCPFKCTYCSNTKFLENDKLAGRVRHASVDTLITEIKLILRDRPFIQSISFHDDCFLALDISILTEFSKQWRKEVGLPFAVHGITPVHVNEEKLVILAEAGLKRIRMGVQSGSDRILKFYKRPNQKGLLQKAFGIISRVQNGMVPPAYDVIVDNPFENDDDVQATILMVNSMPRPFTLNIFSLRSIPGTTLDYQLKNIESRCEPIGNNNYGNLAPTLANVMLFFVATFRVPDMILGRLLRHAHSYHHSGNRFPRLLMAISILFYVKRAFQHLMSFDFSVVFGKFGFFLWKMRLLGRQHGKKFLS